MNEIKNKVITERDDINDAFDDIFMAEDRICDLAKQEGLKIAEQSSYTAGFELGLKKGAEVSQEIGFYLGFIQQLQVHVRSKEEQSKRVVSVVNSLHRMLLEFSSLDTQPALTDEQFSIRLDAIRNKFKQAMSLMKIDVPYQPPSGGHSF